jgi:membrane protein YdbS with pleckstrin-like domain
MTEETLWRGNRSQITNAGKYALCLLLLGGCVVVGFFPPAWFCWFGSIVPILWFAWTWIATRAESFELTTERLRLKKGVLNQVFDEVELYRVKDISHSRSALQRMFGLGTVALLTSDRGQENILIDSVRQSDELREHLRKQVEIIRDRKRVREVDFQEDASHPA